MSVSTAAILGYRMQPLRRFPRAPYFPESWPTAATHYVTNLVVGINNPSKVIKKGWPMVSSDRCDEGGDHLVRPTARDSWSSGPKCLESALIEHSGCLDWAAPLRP